MANTGPTRGRRALESIVLLALAGLILFGPVKLAVRVARASGGTAGTAVVTDVRVGAVASSRHGQTVVEVTHVRIGGESVKLRLPERFSKGSSIAVRYPQGEPEGAVLGDENEGFPALYAKNAGGWKTWGLLALGVLFGLLGLAYLKDAIRGPDPNDIV